VQAQRSAPSDEDVDKLAAGLEEVAAPLPRGRPHAWRSKNERTFQSFAAFVFVVGELRTFRLRSNKPYIPAKVRRAFIAFSKQLYPLAADDALYEHLRKDQRLLPDYEKPTCFLLIRHEFESGITGNVIISGPSDLRRT